MYKYQEEYQLALEGFARAGALDPSWPEPASMEKQVLAYLQQVSDLISTKVSTVFPYFWTLAGGRCTYSISSRIKSS